MTANAIAISRNLVVAGLDKKAADAIAEAVVVHADETHATKADIAELRAETKADIAELRAETKADIAELRAETKADIAELKGEIKALVTQVRLLIGLVAGLYVGIALLFLGRLPG